MCGVSSWVQRPRETSRVRGGGGGGGGLVIHEKRVQLARTISSYGAKGVKSSETSRGSPPVEMQISGHAQG